MCCAISDLKPTKVDPPVDTSNLIYCKDVSQEMQDFCRALGMTKEQIPYFIDGVPKNWIVEEEFDQLYLTCDNVLSSQMLQHYFKMFPRKEFLKCLFNSNRLNRLASYSPMLQKRIYFFRFLLSP